MTILHAGEIGRFDEVLSVLDADILTILRSGVLNRITAETLAAYIVAENTTRKELVFADSPYDVTILDDYINVDTSGGNVVINLLPLATVPIKPVSIKKIDSSGNTVTIDGDGSENIDQASTHVISSQFNAITVIPFSTEWRIY